MAVGTVALQAESALAEEPLEAPRLGSGAAKPQPEATRWRSQSPMRRLVWSVTVVVVAAHRRHRRHRRSPVTARCEEEHRRRHRCSSLPPRRQMRRGAPPPDPASPCPDLATLGVGRRWKKWDAAEEGVGVAEEEERMARGRARQLRGGGGGVVVAHKRRSGAREEERRCGGFERRSGGDERGGVREEEDKAEPVGRRENKGERIGETDVVSIVDIVVFVWPYPMWQPETTVACGYHCTCPKIRSTGKRLIQF
ncbi:hypothetical protein OsJ_01309 [Oryza sativa Japonica Group]|uniref:Uncharacterized protein n=1 Tax=Oryza sativa subsp. japonica TaxID=39947 RepID=B9EV85_ORYSJ|nr:hypothetical protein OsJ_01309 [Oryza sativa Japonica Group]